MRMAKYSVLQGLRVVVGGATLIVLTACANTAGTAGGPARAEPSRVSSVSSVSIAPTSDRPTIRINAGASEAVTDGRGTKWAADTGAVDGETIERPDLEITGTPTPEIYRSERYAMSAYTLKVPNGKYLVKLHFSEDYDGIGSAEDRKFTYALRDGDATGKTIKEVKDFSPWKAAGAQFKAYVDSVPMTVSSGQITVTFVPQVENPQINAIEIIPQ